jgi:quinol monooxygenase YgiN
MAGVGLFVDVRIKPAHEGEFLAATRLYRFRTAQEAGTSHCDVLRADGVEDAFVIYASFVDARAVDRHFASTYAKQWIEAVAGFLAAPIEVRRFQIAIRGAMPPPLPRRPVLESSASLGSFQALGKAHAPPNMRVAGPERLKLPRLEVVVEEMDFAAASDGPLRGMPDPCFLLACYDLDGEPLLLGRVLYRFTLEEAAPCSMRCAERLLDVAVPRPGEPFRCLLVLVAFEENGGTDATRVYQELGRPEAFMLWGSEQSLPNPLTVAEYAQSIQPGQAHRIQMLCHGRALQDSASDDSWVGAGAALSKLQQGEDSLLHFSVHSSDGKNDWTLRLSLRFS